MNLRYANENERTSVGGDKSHILIPDKWRADLQIFIRKRFLLFILWTFEVVSIKINRCKILIYKGIFVTFISPVEWKDFLKRKFAYFVVVNCIILLF